MVKYIPQYSQKLLPNEFLKYFTSCCKEISNQGATAERSLILSNLFRNYKSYHKDYSQSTTVVNSMLYWFNKLKFEDPEIIKLLEEKAYEEFENSNGKNLRMIALAFKDNKDFVSKLESYIFKNLNKFDSKSLSEFSEIIKSNDFLLNLHYNKSFNVSNALDLLYFLKSCEDPVLLNSLENSFKLFLPNMTDTQALCNILYEFTKKNYSIDKETIFLIEKAMLRPDMPLNLKDAHHLLKACNHFTLYDRSSLLFWEKLTEKMKKQIDQWPAATTLSYFSQEGFYIQELYAILIEN